VPQVGATGKREREREREREKYSETVYMFFHLFSLTHFQQQKINYF
jgi:hypothetical protein